MENLRRISATGPDGAGKDTAWRIAKPYLPPDLTIVKIGKPSSVVIGGKEIFVHEKASKALDKLHTLSDERRDRKLTTLSNALIVLFQWRLQEPYLVNKFNPDLVFSLRDGYVDPAAYAPYYSPGGLGRLEIPERVSALHRLHGSPFRDKTVLLDIQPAVAVDRIKQRIKNEATMLSLKRPKWQHQHENEDDLTRIRGEFFNVLSHLERDRGTTVTKIDTTNAKKEDVGYQLAQNILVNFGVTLPEKK